MGRTSKFTFPVPGRKQKQQQNPGPVVTGSMSKAQKILGTGDINIDSSRQWDQASNQSGISISVSESTASHNPSQRGLESVREEGQQQKKGGQNQYQWEQESETVPSYLRSNRFSRMPSSDAPGRDIKSETSSLLRRTSSSTIMSWYDKAKMPLSISQQTSASAMAKGLPPKTKASVDTGDSPKAKKKPARLDLSYLLPRHRHHPSTSVNASQSSAVLEPDYMMRSPSAASTAIMTPGIANPPPIKQRSDRTPGKKSTKERLADIASAAIANRPNTSSSNRKGATEAAGLKHLYEHYEQASFRAVLSSPREDAQEKALPAPSFEQGQTSAKSTEQVPKASPNKPDVTTHERQHSHDIFPPTPISANPKFYSSHLSSMDPDCAASVSSRHTKTSKASKRTNRSFGESDLQEKSVLSLSSDSEDDYYTASAPKSAMSIPSIRGPSDSEDGSSPTNRSQGGSIRQGQTPSVNSRKSKKHASFAPDNTFLTIPILPPSAKPPVCNPRSSSLPMPRFPPPPPAIRSSSRLSTMSTSTTNSNMDWQGRSGYGVHEARAVCVLPPSAKGRSFSDDQASLSSRLTISTKSASLHSGDQPTPPLSPSSVDYYTRSAGSSIDASGNQNPRFMAVTRQEEMLLAALRMKRARMRENIISEYEEDGRVQNVPDHQQTPSQANPPYSTSSESSQKLRHQASATSNSTVRQDNHATQRRGRRGSSVSEQNNSRSSPPAVLPPAPASHSDLSLSSKAVSFRTSMFEKEASPSAAKQERVLLFLERPGTVDALDQAEPSPDLSDFMDFDDGSEDDDEVASDEFLYHHDHQTENLASTHASGKVTSGLAGRVRPDSTPLSPKSPPPALVEQVRVVEADAEEDVVDVPRPDSPISPHGSFSISNQAMGKKKAVRLSAVGRVGMEVGWWGDDG